MNSPSLPQVARARNHATYVDKTIEARNKKNDFKSDYTDLWIQTSKKRLGIWDIPSFSLKSSGQIIIAASLKSGIYRRRLSKKLEKKTSFIFFFSPTRFIVTCVSHAQTEICAVISMKGCVKMISL